MGPCVSPINVIPSPGCGYKSPHKQAPSVSEKTRKVEVTQVSASHFSITSVISFSAQFIEDY
uniref:Uncharacterized protein n=1 Tax=Salix viminalis TaxID=40686 RepID=A0A6N2MWJ3_SALVM